jgi:protocatechuate 3,4-dioxygenase beta subunit
VSEPHPGGRRAYRVAAVGVVALGVGLGVAWVTAPAEELGRPRAAAPPREVPDERAAPRTVDPSPADELPIAGWVIDGAGAPIAGVQVTARDAAGVGFGRGDESDEDGAFRIELPTSGTLVFEGPHVFPAEVRWQAGGPPPRILLSRRMSIDARVTTSGGAPVEGAEVHVSDGSSPTLESALTGADGIARFDDLQAGPYELWARLDRSASPLVRTIHDGGADPLGRVELVLEPAGAVRGQVIGPGAAAAVRLVPVGVDHAVRVAELDEQGGFTIDGVPFGRWRVEADAPGWFQTGDGEVEVAGAPEEIEVRLERAGVVSGTVVDGAGQPVAGATLVLRHGDSVLRLGRAAASLGTSDAMHDLPTMRWVHPLAGKRLMPWRDFGRFGAHREGPRPAECGRGHCGIDLGGKRGATVHAAADGVVALVFTEIRKEAGRYVAIDHPGGLRSYYMHLDDVRADLEIGQVIRGGDPLGTVGRTGVVKDAPHLHFSIAQERGDRTWYIDPEPILQHAVVLPVARALDAPHAAAPTVIATTPGAVDDTAPTARAEKIATDAFGRFRIEGVTPGELVAVAFHAELAPGASEKLVVVAGQETSGVTIALDPGVVVHGRVLGLRGAVAGARVVAEEGFGQTSHKVATAFTDARGDYTLRTLSGKVALTVSAAGHGEVTRAVALDARGRTAERRREDFELVLEDERLTGEVVDPDGHAAAAVDVRIVEGPTRGRRVVTDARGQFVLDGVAPGSYVVELTSPAFPKLRAPLAPGRHAEVRLERGGAIALEVRDAHTAAPLAGLRVDADGPGERVAAATTSAHGLAELAALAPGAWKLRVRAEGYISGELRVDVAASRTPREVRIELSRGATLAGVVRDRYGRRVAGATVTAGGLTTRTDADGNFRFTDVPTGAIEVIAEHEAARGTVSLQARPGDEHVTLKIDLAD